MIKTFEISKIPLSIYVHIPWCEKKCPYCDFNSHEVLKNLPEIEYIKCLEKDLILNEEIIRNRPIQSIFFGGGTPNLFSTKSIKKIMNFLKNNFNLRKDIEVTLEANPGNYPTFLKSVDYFQSLKEIGVSRLSIGVQSFDNKNLKNIGRVHTSDQSYNFTKDATEVFSNINIDLMYGMPGRTLENVKKDLAQAISFPISHLSIYQLTIEPNTKFFNFPPILPNEDNLWTMYKKILNETNENYYERYEISAFSKKNKNCLHNLNYWKFGDYLGVGAGAHSKITFHDHIERQNCLKSPQSYMNQLSNKNNHGHKKKKTLSVKEIPFEFMLNALRLTNGFNIDLFSVRTGESFNVIEKIVHEAAEKKMLSISHNKVKPTKIGLNFLNDLQQMFLNYD